MEKARVSWSCNPTDFYMLISKRYGCMVRFRPYGPYTGIWTDATFDSRLAYGHGIRQMRELQWFSMIATAICRMQPSRQPSKLNYHQIYARFQNKTYTNCLLSLDSVVRKINQQNGRNRTGSHAERLFDQNGYGLDEQHQYQKKITTYTLRHHHISWKI